MRVAINSLVAIQAIAMALVGLIYVAQGNYRLGFVEVLYAISTIVLFAAVS